MSKQSPNDPCACKSGRKYKKCCYRNEPPFVAKAPQGVYLTDEDRQRVVDEGIAKQGGRITDPNAVYPCWRCGVATRTEPCDADGSGETGMLWPPYCHDCGTHDKAQPVRVDAFKARYPGVKFDIAPASVLALVNQAFYGMMARRGLAFDGSHGKA